MTDGLVRIQRPGPLISAKDIASLESHLGAKLPDDYKHFLLKNNGGVPEANTFPVITLNNESGVNWFYGVRTPGDSFDLLTAQPSFQGRLPHRMIAVAEASFGNQVCMSLSPNEFGRIYYWVHDVQVAGDPHRALFTLAASFVEFFALLRPFELDHDAQASAEAEVVWVDPEFLRTIKDQ